MKYKSLVLLPVMALALATLACNALASRLRPTPIPNPPGPVPTATQRGNAPAPTAGPVGEGPLHIAGGPTIGSPRETRVALAAGAETPPILEQLAKEQYSQDEMAKVGGTFEFTIALTQTGQVLWAYGWCATSADVVTQNLEHMAVEFSINGTPVDPGQFQVVEDQSGNLSCRTAVAVIYDWPSGTTTVETKLTFLEKVNDGISDYPPGTQDFVYTVTAP